jgi:hypothetical protein
MVVAIMLSDSCRGSEMMKGQDGSEWQQQGKMAERRCVHKRNDGTGNKPRTKTMRSDETNLQGLTRLGITPTRQNQASSSQKASENQQQSALVLKDGLREGHVRDAGDRRI